ncbi:cytochrome c [Fulvimonas soli]|uniref:Cytochrome c n=1 Tax=Fulvimonas soli TaxID=155197 RepID=A0A316IG10_9GAMM|nr:cytochrome c [Fulvimonas soli]PWK91949.1 cytochrome c [Fulvimonas soli]TNY25152.1 cytochrome C [Fulvimonas soli]
MRTLLACLLLWCPLLAAAELKVDLGHGATVYRTAQLLARPELREIVVPGDVVFKRTMRYRALPVAALLRGVGPDDQLQFVAADGFAAEIPAGLVLGRHGSRAWLAVEDPARPWPAPAEGKPGIGPFYLVWTDPQAAGIGPEQWPYQLAAIRRLPGPAARFPAILPDPALPPDSPVRRGFAVFQRNCFACHTLNGEGDARLGPDLNIPHNPTEYLPAGLLRAFIRDPQSLRRWPQAKMQGFPTRRELSDADLDALLAYLRHMAGRKRTP